MNRLCIIIILNYKISGYFHYIFDFEKNELLRLVSELFPTSYCKVGTIKEARYVFIVSVKCESVLLLYTDSSKIFTAFNYKH